jgi:hypothetical protein
MEEILPPELKAAAPELAGYFADAFGSVPILFSLLRVLLSATCSFVKNPSTKSFLTAYSNMSRIDYGTGHETSFVAFLACMYQLQLITKEDLEAIAFRAFDRCAFLHAPMAHYLSQFSYYYFSVCPGLLCCVPL